MAKLTKSLIDKTPIPEVANNGKHTQTFLRDSSLQGFALRISSGGTRTFIVETRINRKVKRISIGRYGILTCEEARIEARKILGDIAKGGDPIENKKLQACESITLQEAFNDYLVARKDLKDGTIHDYKRCIENSLSHWLDKQLINIDKDMIDKCHRELGENSRARANNTMRVLRAVFNFAIEKYQGSDGKSALAFNPVDRLSQSRAWFKVERRRNLIKPHQLKPWFDATNKLNIEVTRDYLQFVLLTGLRRSEAAKLTWSQIDFNDSSFEITDTKNSQPHTLPLSNYLVELLKRRKQEHSSNWVFPSNQTDSYLKEPRSAIAKVIELSDVDFTLHDLRRTFITIAESIDIPAYALKHLINHKNGADVTAGYIVINIERLREPMQRVTDFIMGKVKNV